MASGDSAQFVARFLVIAPPAAARALSRDVDAVDAASIAKTLAHALFSESGDSEMPTYALGRTKVYFKVWASCVLFEPLE